MIFSFQRKIDERSLVPNLIIKNFEENANNEFESTLSEEDNKKTRFIDATGVEVGRLLGDVKHDPYESGGLGTPPHEVAKDKKSINFNKKSIIELINIARELSPKQGTSTLALRKLGEYVRAAINIAKSQKKQIVSKTMLKKRSKCYNQLKHKIYSKLTNHFLKMTNRKELLSSFRQGRIKCDRNN